MSVSISLPAASAPRRLRLDVITPWIFPVLILLVWQLGCDQGWITKRVLPSPVSVLRAGFDLAQSGELQRHVMISCQRALLGFVIGGSLGFGFGVLNGLSRGSERLLDTSVQMLRNVPHLAIIPLVILWFGIDEAAKLFLVAVGVFFPIYLNTHHGVRQIDPGLLEMARIYRLRGLRAVPPRGAAGRHALHFARRTLRPRHHVADPYRRRDDLRLLRYRLHDDERARVPANRCGPARRADVRAAGQARRCGGACAGTAGASPGIPTFNRSRER